MNQVVRISLVGDIFPSNLLYTCGFGNGSVFLQDKEKYWEKHLFHIFKEFDISFANLEVPLVDDDDLVNNSAFAGSTLFAQTLKKGGINIVSIANNHILEQGIGGFLSTQEALKNANLSCIGTFNNYKSNIEIIECKGLRFGFGAFNAIKDIPNNNLHADLGLENIKRTLDEMCLQNVDYKLLSFHWGNEYTHIPSMDQIRIAHAVIDYGADVIIGHHPHVIQPIERYNKGLILYSLGNFIFDFLFSKDFRTGMMVDLKFNKDSEIDYSISEVTLNEGNLNSVQKSEKFNRKLESYYNQMNELLLHSEDYYNKQYNKTLKINRFYQRVMMKLKLLELLFSKHKKLTLENVLKRISNSR